MKPNLLSNLIAIRLKAMIRNFGKSLPGKKKSKAIPVVFALLFAYMLVAFEFIFVILWASLSVFCTVGLTWLYFGLAGLVAMAMTILCNVFTTQNQLYNASDNELLLSMPIPPGAILLSRMAVLLATALGTTLLTVAPAVGVYIYHFGGLTLPQWVGVLASVLAVTLAAQGLSCVLGYLLHLLLRRVRNKAIGSMVFMLLFLALYLTAYSKAGAFLTYLAANGEEVAARMRSWAVPFYALGLACTGNLLCSLLLILGALALFAIVYWVLAATFFPSVQGRSASGAAKPTHKTKADFKPRSPVDTVCHKELRRLLTSPIYLTNTGLGCIMLLAVAVAAPFFGGKIHTYLMLLPAISRHLPLISLVPVAMLNGMACFTAPSVSLEGKSLWVMRSMPISGRDVLLGKLKLHVLLSGSTSVLAGLSVTVTLGCTIPEILLVTLLSFEIALLTGMLGLIYNLALPNFKWINEATPCKQGMPVLFAMLTGMGLVLLGGVGWYLTEGVLSVVVYLLLLVTLLLLAVLLLYRLIVTWGSKRFTSFE